MLPEDVNRLERNGVPLYVQLARILAEEIHSSKYKAGDALPTEQQISKTFGVSIITVREARRILVDQGLIVRRSGKGTFVADKPPNGAFLAASSIEDLVYAGHEIETRRQCVRRRLVQAGQEIAELLQIPVKTKVLEIESIMYAGEAPFSCVSVNVSFALGRRVPERRLAEKPMILLLSEICNIRVAEVDQWTTASHADKRIAEALGITVDDSVLVVQRVFYDSNGHPILSSANTFRSDRFRQHVHLQWGTLGSRPQRGSIIGPGRSLQTGLIGTARTR
jgi:DNA-binding GntR family transcriptional regulator